MACRQRNDLSIRRAASIIPERVFPLARRPDAQTFLSGTHSPHELPSSPCLHFSLFG